MTADTATNPIPRVRQSRPFILAALTIFAFIANYAGILAGIAGILSPFLYVPVILAGYWYPKRGVVFAVVLSCTYGVMTMLLAPLDMHLIITFLFQMAFFIIIGWVVSLISSRLRESEQQLHDIVEFLPSPTFAVDRDGIVIAWNQEIEELTGVKKADILGKGGYVHSQAIYGECRPALVDFIISPEKISEERYPFIRTEGRKLISEIYLPHLHGGKGMHLRLVATALIDSQGNLTGAIESLRDITDQVLTASALQNTGSRLTTLSGIIRHDLSRTLGVVYGHLSMGVMKFDNPDVLTFIDDIRHSVNGIQRQIEMSRVFRDLGSSPPAWMPVQAILAEATAKLGCRNVTFRIWTERLEVFADPNLPAAFYQVLYYYLRELKGFTKIVVTYHVKDNACRILIEDSGSGTGIPDADKPSLFTQRNDRTGYGLFLAHEILGITGMTIRETGMYGKGVRFEILLPADGFRIRGWEAWTA